MTQTLEENLERRGWSQTDLAERLGVSTAAVSRWLSGERTPSLEMAFRIEELLGIPAETWRPERTGTDG